MKNKIKFTLAALSASAAMTAAQAEANDDQIARIIMETEEEAAEPRASDYAPTPTKQTQAEDDQPFSVSHRTELPVQGHNDTRAITVNYERPENDNIIAAMTHSFTQKAQKPQNPYAMESSWPERDGMDAAFKSEKAKVMVNVPVNKIADLVLNND